ncbi:MAG: PEP-CTERM sorting domain-containing protein [Rhodocyclaceae bacterium]
MKMKYLVAAVLAFSAGLAQATAVQFTFGYTDVAGYGFNDATYGAQRRAAIEMAGTYWGSLLQASYAGETISINVSFDSASTANSPLSSTGVTNLYSNSQMDNKGLHNVTYSAPLAEHLAGRNLNGTSFDSSLKFNANVPTYLGLDGHPGSTEYDFFSYALRGVGRTLGINTRVDNGASASGLSTMGLFYTQFDADTNATIRMPGIYDTFLVDGNGKSWLSMTQAERVAAQTNGPLFWTGENGNAQHGGVPLQVNAMPLRANGTLDGAGIVYLAPSNSTLMTHNGIVAGQAMGIDAQTAGMLVDMGWKLSVPLPVPEASTYAMLLAGLGMIGVMARRRSA